MKPTLMVLTPFVFTTLLSACMSQESQESTESVLQDRSPKPSAQEQYLPFLPKSCASDPGTHCGKKSPDGCWCDALCEQYKDCCPDKKAVCDDPGPTPNPKSCVNHCGKKSPWGCWCDKWCEQYKDCCPDKQAVCDDPGPTPEPPGPDVQELASGDQITISGNQGEWKFYKMSSCSQAYLSINLSGGTGNPDIYLQKNSIPTLESYYCKSLGPDTSDTCQTVSRPFIGVYAKDSYQNVNMRVVCFAPTMYPTPPPEVVELNNGDSIEVSAGQGEWKKYHIKCDCNVSAKLSGGSGNPSLYAQHNSPPDLTGYGCKSDNPGTSEKCASSNATSMNSYYVYVYAEESFNDVTLDVACSAD